MELIFLERPWNAFWHTLRHNFWYREPRIEYPPTGADSALEGEPFATPQATVLASGRE